MIHRLLLLGSMLVMGHTLAARQSQATTSGLPLPARLLLTITDKAGRPVSEPKASEFKVFEEGKLQTITAFKGATSLPLSIFLAVDASGSSTGNDEGLNSALNASVQLVQAVLRRGIDRVALLTFSSFGKMEQEFTDDPGNLIAAINRGLATGGGTSLYDGLAKTSEILTAWNGRRVIIVISDGVDTTSQLSLEQMLKKVIQNDGAIFAIYTAGPRPGAISGKNVLERISEDTGGSFFDSRDLKKFDGLRDVLNTQYFVEFQSAKPVTNTKFRKIKVDTLNKDYRVLYRRLYYPSQ